MNMMEQKEFMSANLKEIRNSLKFTQEKMAEELGLNYRTYRYYERGKSNIPYDVLYQLHVTYDVDLNRFICGDIK